MGNSRIIFLFLLILVIQSFSPHLYVNSQFLESFGFLGEDLSYALDKIVEIKFKNNSNPFEIIFNDTLNSHIEISQLKISNKMKKNKRKNMEKLSYYIGIHQDKEGCFDNSTNNNLTKNPNINKNNSTNFRQNKIGTISNSTFSKNFANSTLIVQSSIPTKQKNNANYTNSHLNKTLTKTKNKTMNHHNSNNSNDKVTGLKSQTNSNIIDKTNFKTKEERKVLNLTKESDSDNIKRFTLNQVELKNGVQDSLHTHNNYKYILGISFIAIFICSIILL